MITLRHFYRLSTRLALVALCAALPLTSPLAEAQQKQPQTPAEWLWQAQITDVNGKPVQMSAYKGQPLVVNFWASWCNPCVREMPMLDKLSREYAKKGVKFVGIAIDSPQNVQKFEQKVKVSYPLLIGGMGGGETMRRLGNALGGLPFTVVIDKKGQLRLNHLGEIQPADVNKAVSGL